MQEKETTTIEEMRFGPWTLPVLVAVSMAAGVAAFPPLDIGAFAWFGLVPLLLALSQVRPTAGFFIGWLYGAVFMGVTCSFLGIFGTVPLLVFALVFGLFYALFGLGAALVQGRCPVPALRIAGIAGLWVLLEMARGKAGPLAFTFSHLAYSQHDQLPMLQVVSIFGHYGLSFLIAMINAALATVLLAMLPPPWRIPCTMQERGRLMRLAGKAALIAYGLVIVTFIWGALIMRINAVALDRQLTTEGRTVAVVQGAEPGGLEGGPESVTSAAHIYTRLSDFPQQVEFILWPETAVAAVLAEGNPYREMMEELARSRNTALVAGGLEQEDGRIYNSAYFFSPEGELVETYRKMDLVLFGEYVPFRDELPFLQNFPIRDYDFSPGHRRALFTISDMRLSPLICFEGIFPEPSRECTRRGAEVLAILTSDAWAEGTFERVPHSNIAVFRAIESRRFLLRAATSGISAVYDSYGRMLGEIDYDVPGAVIQEILPQQELSGYHQWGDWPLAAVAAAFLALAFIIRKLPEEQHCERQPSRGERKHQKRMAQRR